MIYELRMPDLTTNDAPVRIVRWLAQPGETITRGQPLLEAETDKATMEVESAISGRLDQVLCQADQEVSVGQVIAVFDVADSTPIASIATAAPTASAAQPMVVPPVAVPSAAKPVGMFARNRAAASAVKVPAASLPLTVAQRTAARRLQSSKQTIPHFYLQTSFNASMIVARRQAAKPFKLAWDAFFVRAVAVAISRFDRFRCRFDGERLVPADCDAIGVAIDRDNELFVIPVPAPAGKTFEQVSDEIRRAAERLRNGDQEVRRIHSALMTVTNLGVCDVESFVPIINPPEAAILGVGKVMLTPVVQDNGQLVAQQRGTLTLCVDHRVASGRYAAEFLGAIVAELETM